MSLNLHRAEAIACVMEEGGHEIAARLIRELVAEVQRRDQVTETLGVPPIAHPVLERGWRQWSKQHPPTNRPYDEPGGPPVVM